VSLPPQSEVRHLKEQLALQEESRSPSVAGTDAAAAADAAPGVALVDTLVSSIHCGVAERINLQKALFEVQDADVRTRAQLAALQCARQVCSGLGGIRDNKIFEVMGELRRRGAAAAPQTPGTARSWRSASVTTAQR
jgi:hypothetical protein